MVYLGEVSPPAYAGLTQRLYGSFSPGLGSILGSLIGGVLFARIGGLWLYRLAMGIFSLLCLFLIPIVRARQRSSIKETR